MDFEAVGTKRNMQLSELDEWREKHIITLRYIRRGPRDGMIRGLRRRSSHQKIRYYFLILGLNYSDTKNFKANGKDYSR
jgi:hypothetical protein